jgi:hypothetical protein
MRNESHSAVFTFFHQAILERRRVTCIYKGRYREVCPHILGHTRGAEKVLVFQIGGESEGGLPPGGNWRCFDLAFVENAEAREGRWRSGDSHRKSQRCVEEVFVDVNEDVPNQPGRR